FTVQVTAEDAAGNTSAATDVTLEVRDVDDTAPTVTNLGVNFSTNQITYDTDEAGTQTITGATGGNTSNAASVGSNGFVPQSESTVVTATLDVTDAAGNTGSSAGLVGLGTTGDDTIVGAAENDVLVGFGGDNTLRGKGGDDILVGGTGDDVIRGGAGNDVMVSGSDSDDDVFRIAFGGEGEDTIRDFDTGGLLDATEDVLDFAGSSDVANVSNAGNYAEERAYYLYSTVTADDGFLVINNGYDGLGPVGIVTNAADSLDAGDVAAYLGNIGVKTAVRFENTDSVFYLAVSDGTDTAIFRADAAAGNSDTVIDATELTKIVTLLGIDDAGDLGSDNFTDFS
ncbi:calcium-binding protein, partial [Roseospira goensis]